MAASNVSNAHADAAANLANAQGRLLAVRFAQRLTQAIAGMNGLEGELERLSEDERIGFAEMIGLMLQYAASATDVNCMAERINGCHVSTLERRAAALTSSVRSRDSHCKQIRQIVLA